MNPILPSPERTMSFKCRRCGAEIKISDYTRLVRCAGCATEMIVERKHGTITLILTESEQRVNEGERRDSLSSVQLANKVTALKDELSRIRRRKILVLFVGGTCGLIFGAFGIAGIIINDVGLGLTMLLCAGGAGWFVLFVSGDSRSAAEKINKETQHLEHHMGELQASTAQKISASNLGIDQIAVELYVKEVRYYPSWIQHSRSRVPERVSRAAKDGSDTVRLTMHDVEYVFDWEQRRLAGGQQEGELTVTVNNMLALSITALVAEDQWMISTSAHAVQRFVEGPWVAELLALWAESKECISHQRKAEPW